MGKKEEEEVGRIVGDQVVVVNPKPSGGLASKLLDWLEKVAVKLGYDSKQSLHYLMGNFAPVVEETPPFMDLPVKGHLPVSKFGITVNHLCVTTRILLVNSCEEDTMTVQVSLFSFFSINTFICIVHKIL